jgi:CRP-like cAMP-binding protein
MNTEKLFSVLSAIHPISPDFKESIERELTPLSLPAGYLLLEAPKVEEHAYFLDSGFAMSYTFLKGKKQVESFWGPGQIIFSARSFFEEVPAREFIQLMQTSELLCISYKSVKKLFEIYPVATYIQRIVMNQYLELERDRIRDLYSASTADRLSKLVNHYPGIEQIVPQENIASYLGITPQSLSRVKKRSGLS